MGLSIWKVLIILLIVVLIFGAGKLPRVMGDLAKGVRNFKSGMRDGEDVAQATGASGTSRDEALKS